MTFVSAGWDNQSVGPEPVPGEEPAAIPIWVYPSNSETAVAGEEREALIWDLDSVLNWWGLGNPGHYGSFHANTGISVGFFFMFLVIISSIRPAISFPPPQPPLVISEAWCDFTRENNFEMGIIWIWTIRDWWPYWCDLKEKDWNWCKEKWKNKSINQNSYYS